MKNAAIVLLLLATCITACQNEKNTSEVEQKRQELEAKRLELKEKQELVALKQEMKNVEAEIDRTEGKNPAKPASASVSPTGRIRGDNVIMRADYNTESGKITNFVNGETVSILTWKSNGIDGQTWYQVRRSDNQVGWVFGKFLEEI